MGIGGIVSLSDNDPVALRLSRCLEEFGTLSGRVLEIGCGAGRMIRNLAFYCPGIRPHGCDISHAALVEARKAMPSGTFTAADVQALPYADGTCDAVVGFDILEHVNDVRGTIAETYRVLKRGGRFHLHAPCEGNPLTIYWLLDLIGFRTDLKRQHAGHIQRLRSRNLLRDLKNQGYQVTSVSYSWHLIGQLTDLERYLSWSVLPPHGSAASPRKGLLGFCLKFLYLFEDILAVLFICEARLLKHFPLAMGIHVTCIKEDNPGEHGT